MTYNPLKISGYKLKSFMQNHRNWIRSELTVFASSLRIFSLKFGPYNFYEHF